MSVALMALANLLGSALSSFHPPTTSVAENFRGVAATAIQIAFPTETGYPIDPYQHPAYLVVSP